MTTLRAWQERALERMAAWNAGSFLLSAALLSLGAALPALAHEGHGLPGSAHWHSTDVIGYLLAAGIVALLWFNRRK